MFLPLFQDLYLRIIYSQVIKLVDLIFKIDISPFLKAGFFNIKVSRISKL